MDYELLYRLSVIDKQISKVNKVLNEKKKVLELKNLKNEYISGKNEYDEMRKREFEINKNINEIEVILNTKAKEKEMYTQNLYSTPNAKTIHTCEDTIKKIDDDIRELNEKEYVFMLEQEKLSASIKEKYNLLSNIGKKYNNELKEYKENNDKNNEIIKALNGDRENILPKISKGVLSDYENILKQLGSAMSEVHGEICSGCKLDIPIVIISKAKYEKTLVKCPNCGRYIYISD